jgi:hypothetical protein
MSYFSHVFSCDSHNTRYKLLKDISEAFPLNLASRLSLSELYFVAFSVNEVLEAIHPCSKTSLGSAGIHNHRLSDVPHRDKNIPLPIAVVYDQRTLSQLSGEEL